MGGRSNQIQCIAWRLEVEKMGAVQEWESFSTGVTRDRFENSLPCKLNISVNVSRWLLSEAADKGLFFIL